ncbi:PLP-dependent aminotransferase family protein [Streptomyces capparidis]
MAGRNGRGDGRGDGRGRGDRDDRGRGAAPPEPGGAGGGGRPEGAAGGAARDPGWTLAWELLLPAAGAGRRRRGWLLRDALRDAVRSGVLAPGTRLPPSRELAADLGVSRGLVTDAYAQLTAEGYLVTRTGAGTWVARLRDAARRPAPPAAPAGPPPDVADFRPGRPDLSLFPRASWGAAQRRVLAQLPSSGLDYPDPRGLPALREALAALLARRRGVAVDADRLIVCSGVAQALTLLSRVAFARGLRRVATEDPGSLESWPLFEAAGLRPVPVPVDGAGLDPAALAASGARLAVVTPAHQFPSGVSYSAARRAALLAWARSADGLVVEDDYDGDFRYDREPVGALQGLDPARVAYTGSVSKTLAPGLRLGWLVCPPALLDEVAEVKRTTDLGHPSLDQAVLADFVAGGHYDRHLRRAQRRYRDRRDALVGALARHFPDARVRGVAAGLHLIARFPGLREADLASLAGAAGVRLRPLSDYTVAARPAPDAAELVLGYAHLAPGEIDGAVRALAEAVRARHEG